MILAIDTSSAASAAAITDGDTVLVSAAHVDARRHAEVLAPLIAELRSQVDAPVDAVAVGVGPGPYTGLRVGIATAQALAAAWQVPVLGVCSLDIIAAEAVEAGVAEPFAAASDARRREVYWATFDDSGERTEGPFVSVPAAIGSAAYDLPWVGEGAHLHAEALGRTLMPEIRFPSAPVLGRLVAALLAAGIEPAAPTVGLSVHGGDDGSTSRSLERHRLLTASPLYVRRPDAVDLNGAS